MTESSGAMFQAAREQQPVFECPVCKKTSHHPTDREEGYCAWCHEFTGKRTNKGFTVAVTRGTLAEVNRRIKTIEGYIATEVGAGRPTRALELSLASLVGFRTDLREQLREVGEEVEDDAETG